MGKQGYGRQADLLKEKAIDRATCSANAGALAFRRLHM